MLARILLGVMALGFPEESQEWQNVENATATREASVVGIKWSEMKNASKLHVGMLTISLIVCLVYGAYVGFTYWREKNILVSHVRNLVIALFCRTFFTVLFDGVVILDSNTTVGGANTLLALECISQNLVFAFWLMLMVYLHAQVQRKFNSEPTLDLYTYGIPGVAVFFAFIWIFVLQAEYSFFIWWGFLFCIPQWIVSSLRLLYLLVQLGLIVDVGRMLQKISMDNDSLTLLRKFTSVLLALVFLFWLQFGLSLGRLSSSLTSGYLHFDYFIDGSEGGLVCLGLFFFQKWVSSLLNKTQSMRTESGEVLVAGDRGVVTIDEVFMTRESGRWKDSDAAEESRDVVYSSVVEPERLKKTLELYKRLNVLSSSQVTAVEGEEYFDCRGRGSRMSSDSEKVDFRSVISDGPRTPPRRLRTLKLTQMSKQIQKKNAFYASKYLILDSKESRFPKLLETRPSVSSAGKETATEKGPESKIFSSLDRLMSDELVKKWLNDHSDLQPEIHQPPQENPEKSSEQIPQRRAAQPEHSKTDQSKPPESDEVKYPEKEKSEHPITVRIERPGQDVESNGKPKTPVNVSPQPYSGEVPSKSTPRTTDSGEKHHGENKRGTDEPVPTEVHSTETVQHPRSWLERQPTYVGTISERFFSTFNNLFNPGFSNNIKPTSDSDVSPDADDECQTKELQHDDSEMADPVSHPDREMKHLGSEQESTSMASCGPTTEIRSKAEDAGSEEVEPNEFSHSDEERSLDQVLEKGSQASQGQIPVELTINVLPVPPGEEQEELSSDSCFSMEKSSSGSSFSLDKYYLGLQKVRENVNENLHPYAERLKRAKFST